MVFSARQPIYMLCDNLSGQLIRLKKRQYKIVYYRCHCFNLLSLFLINASRLADSRNFVCARLHGTINDNSQFQFTSVEANSLYDFPELLRTNQYNEVSYQQDLIHSKVGASYRQCTRGKVGVGHTCKTPHARMMGSKMVHKILHNFM